MQLGFFAMPMHPIGKDWRLSLAQDREGFVLADELGFVEGYVGEHGESGRRPSQLVRRENHLRRSG